MIYQQTPVPAAGSPKVRFGHGVPEHMMPDPAPPSIGLVAVFLEVLCFDTLACGAVVQLAMLQDALVLRERRTDPAWCN